MSTTIYVNSEPMDLRQLARIEPASIRTLDARGCTGLTALPALPACETLYVEGCTGLTVLPDLPVCRILNAPGCTGLTALPDLPVCHTLDARGCTGLTALPDLPACETLYVEGCTGLNALPDLPACRIIDASGCTGLGVIDAGEDSRGYDFRGVPLRSGWRIFAGCRIKTVEEARAHWGPGGASDRPDCLALVEKIAAEIAKREMQQ